jgi:hypothetical protein
VNDGVSGEVFDGCIEVNSVDGGEELMNDGFVFL